MNVFILATCRKPELFPFTELVFKTLRVGFPTARVTVFFNDISNECHDHLNAIAKDRGCDVFQTRTIHHEWIGSLVANEQEPFYILDTDVIFYGSFEGFTFEKPLAGWRIPEWDDEFSGCITRARLHTSLLYIDPVRVREEIKAKCAVVPNTPFTPVVNVYNPICLPYKGRMYFYDTCGILYHLIGGQAFEPKHKNVYCHMGFGTIPDIVLPRLSDGKLLAEARVAVLNNPELGIGQWRNQDKYFNDRRN